MSRLLRVEFTRLVWRRGVIVLLGLMIVLPLALAAVTLLQKDLPSDALLAEGERLAAEQIELCLADPEGYFGGELPPDVGTPEQFCADSNRPEYYVDLYSQLDLAQEREEGTGFGAAVVVGLLALLAGTTFVGHDWNTGSMGNQLLFVPRRLRVWLAKALAVGIGCLVAAAVGTTLFWLVLASRFWIGGTEIPDGVLLDGLQQGWRAAGIAAFAGLGGFAITMLSRSTVFTLGLLFGISVAGGILIGVLVDDPAWVDPTVNIAAVVQDGATYYVELPESCFSGEEVSETGECDPQRLRELGDGLVYLGVLGAVACTGSILSFRRRDVP